VRAVVLIVAFAVLALQAGLDLSTNTNAVANLDSRHLITNFDGLANHLMSDTERQWCFSPATCDGVDVRTAHSTSINLDVDIAVFKWLWLELQQRSVSFGHRNGTTFALTSCFLKSLHFS